MNKINIKEITTAELEAELLERSKGIVTLRNRLLGEIKKSVEYNEKEDMVKMKKEGYDILVNDWEETTQA